MIPLLSLLGFATWTLLILCLTVGVYRWTHILAGRVSISRWSADGADVGGDFYKRSMRAHANCIENLPVFGALVVVQQLVGIHSSAIDWLALTVLLARIPHTLIHLLFRQTDRVVAFRFTCYFIQVLAMLTMAVAVAIPALEKFPG